ncbi:XRE family transcriptional regulator [Schumannella luteola]|uniref:Transcriptional regulator with XRE-family HTH domain n=1 Tax=Schumannella luteola TaxID=472059 RepID=A0A852YEJ9_9MICO|nr:XRE family transcriptional regulator [Schumannella luteola]NYG97538.1 transcriptional regulator with XRE-family HTH domain [Schumannella luteola]TPX01607.1 helix-turn-helix transcriptional regulator [Schumannella luteola]
MADEPIERTLAGVGERLRRLRVNRNLTLADVSAATSISTSTLSRLESGSRRPALELLLPLAREYGVPLDDLVGAPPTGDPRIHIRPVRHGGRTILPLGRGANGVQAVKFVLPGATAREVEKHREHHGWEWLYVLQGHLRLVLDDEEFVLGSGEAAEFDCRTPHWLGSADGETVEFLGLFDAEGRRVHGVPPVAAAVPVPAPSSDADGSGGPDDAEAATPEA